MDPYQQYIHISRYSRWLPELQRRETWLETVQRYINFLDDHTDGEHHEILNGRVRDAILNLEVMPSMRAMMMAGPALARDNVCGYNCAYVACNRKEVFHETLYILMCGTGMGFSCESDEVNQLPEIPRYKYIRRNLEFPEGNLLDKTERTIIVGDSRKGWAMAYRELINCLYQGIVPSFDMSLVRPAGERLKITGGRSSGPGPLRKLFNFTIKTFKARQGARLTPLDVHDIMCTIGEVVVVGGVRRSALISLSDLSDPDMPGAKSGEWWVDNAQRALANNSAVYNERPSAELFFKEWHALVASQSGERGIFNRGAARHQAARWDKRDWGTKYGTNPCCFTGETLIATADGSNSTRIDELAEFSKGKEKFPVYSARFGSKGWKTEIKMATAHFTAEKPVYTVVLSNGDTFRATDDHLLAMPNGEYVMVKDSVGKELERSLFLSASSDASTPNDKVYVEHIEFSGVEKVYDLTVEDNHNFYIITRHLNASTYRGVLVHNSEIILRDRQFCNLSEVVVRADDTEKTLAAKIEIATILGTFQASLCNFDTDVLSKEWVKNTEEEALLGVSLTGIMDNEMLSAYDSTDTQDLLYDLRSLAVIVNKYWAEKLGINSSTAITCVKPSGTVSQLCDSASGIHTRHSEYYIRTVRVDKKDPLYRFMIYKGLHVEDCKMSKPIDGKGESPIAVVSFPIKSPNGCVTRNDMTAIESLEMWLVYQRHWCHHKPSVTITVRDEEWPEVGAWVFKHFDELSGVSFLPHSEHTYEQAPYQEISKAEYDQWLIDNPMPEIDWSELSLFEKDDNTISSQTLACTGNNCEI